MRQEFRVIITMTFDSAVVRDAGYDKVKTALLNAKPQLGAIRQAHMTKDDYMVNEPATEAI
ncbi:MAG: hypothetical protein ABIJ57_02305 [Pseudomonadota bacterium]